MSALLLVYPADEEYARTVLAEWDEHEKADEFVVPCSFCRLGAGTMEWRQRGDLLSCEMARLLRRALEVRK